MAVRRLRSRQLGLFVRGGSAPQLHPTVAGAGYRGGAKPHHHCYSLPGVPSSSLARGTRDAEQGCGDRASGICGCLASVTPVGPQLIPSLQLPNPFGFVVGFYFFIYFPFLPSRTRTAHRQCDTRVPHMQLFPLHPWSPVVPPALHSHQLGCHLLFILHKCRMCHAVLAGDSPLLWAGVWAGTETLLLVQSPLALQLSTSACPHPRKALSCPSKAPPPIVCGCVWIFGLVLLHQGECSQTTVPGQPA